MDAIAKTMAAALGVGYRTGFRAVEQFAKLAKAAEGCYEEEQRQMLVNFVERGSV